MDQADTAPTLMKVCCYCGRGSDDQAASCPGCGTPFASEDSATSVHPSALFRWTPQSDGGLAVASALAALLLATAFYIDIGRAWLDILIRLHRAPPLPSAGAYNFLLIIPPLLTPVLGIALGFLTCFICLTRCRRRWHGILAAAVSLAILVFLKQAPGIWWLALPAVSLGLLTSSSLGIYLGSALQAALAVWLLGAFARPNASHNSHNA